MSTDRSIYQFDEPASADAGVDAVARNAGERSRIGVIRNPRSRHNVEKPSSATPESGIKLALPDGREAVEPALEELTRDGLDLLVIDGGDGTVRDVLTLGWPVFRKEWPVLAVLPKGKTNALALDLGLPGDWRLPDALAAYDRGKRCQRQPLIVRSLDRPELPVIAGFIFGAGAFTHAIEEAQGAHKVGMFNALAIAATTVSGVAQSIFAGNGNPWRKGSPMEITLDPDGRTAPRSRHGDPAYRNFVLSTTLAKLPMGVKPYGPERLGLKLGIMDLPLRRLLASFPYILTGRLPAWLPGAGYHVHDVPGFTIEVGDPFIVDGEPFPPGRYHVATGAPLTFVVP